MTIEASSSRKSLANSSRQSQDKNQDFGDRLVELGRDFIAERSDRTYRIPIFEPGVRSLNLSNAVSIVVYEALRQTGALSSS